jgi:lipopolysaccharide heptosyltransferase II
LKRRPSGKPALDPASPSKVLLLRLRRIGDVVLTTPAISALKKSFPRASLTYIVEKPYVRLVEDHPALVRVIALDPKPTARDSWRLIRWIRKERFDAVLDFHGGPRTSLWVFLSGARLKVGYLIRGRGWPYDIAVPRSRPEGPIHSSENHLNLVRALGADIPKEPPLSLPPARKKETARVARLFKDTGIAKAKVVVLHIGAGNRFRDWGLENLAALAGKLGSLRGVRVLLVGGEADAPRAAAIMEKNGEHAVSLVGRLNLIELRELIGRAALFVGPDSGPMHIAASTGTPIVAFFGPTLPAHFAPWRRRATLVQKDLDCRPCKQRECLHADFRCLQSISADEVLAACLPYLRKK